MKAIKVKNLIKRLEVFERNKIPVEIKILGIAIYLQNFFSKKNCKNSLRTLSSPKISCSQMDKEI